MRVWLANDEELPAAARLLAEFRDHYGRDTPADAELLAGVERIAADGSGEYLLAADEAGEVVGVCQLRYRWSAWTTSDDAWLEDVFVRESARRIGVGRALVEQAMQRARARGCARIELDVDESNTRALALYLGLGFSGEIKAEQRSLLLGRRLAG